MPLLSLVPPSPWFVFPLFLWRGCWYLPSVSAAPSPAHLQVVLWSRVKVLWSAQKPPGKGRDPENHSEYIFLLSLHEQQGWSTWNLPWNHVQCAGEENMFSPRSQCSVRSACTPRLCCGCWYKHVCLHGSLLQISMILVPHLAPKIPKNTCYF